MDVLADWRSWRQTGHVVAGQRLSDRYVGQALYWVDKLVGIWNVGDARREILREIAVQRALAHMNEVAKMKGRFEANMREDQSDLWVRAGVRNSVLSAMWAELDWIEATDPKSLDFRSRPFTALPHASAVASQHDQMILATYARPTDVGLRSFGMSNDDLSRVLSGVALTILASGHLAQGAHRRLAILMHTGQTLSKSHTGHAKVCRFCELVCEWIDREVDPRAAGGLASRAITGPDRRWLSERSREPAPLQPVFDRPGKLWKHDRAVFSEVLAYVLSADRARQAEGFPHGATFSAWVGQHMGRLVTDYDPARGRRFWQHVLWNWTARHEEDLRTRLERRFSLLQEIDRDDLFQSFMELEFDAAFAWFDAESDPHAGAGFYKGLVRRIYQLNRDFVRHALARGSVAPEPDTRATKGPKIKALPNPNVRVPPPDEDSEPGADDLLEERQEAATNAMAARKRLADARDRMTEGERLAIDAKGAAIDDLSDAEARDAKEVNRATAARMGLNPENPRAIGIAKGRVSSAVKKVRATGIVDEPSETGTPLDDDEEES